MCARIQRDGGRCKNPATVVHHLVSPKDAPSLFLVVANVVPVCSGCHPAGECGTPEWKPNADYVPTFAGFGFLGQSNPN
jgi:hypothetical protein